MIVVDASVVIPWLTGADYPECRRLESALQGESARFAPITATELLSDPRASEAIVAVVENIRHLDLDEGYWSRAGLLRRALLQGGRRARTPDALLAQACIDHGLPLLSRDRDFAAFAEIGGLKLA